MEQVKVRKFVKIGKPGYKGKRTVCIATGDFCLKHTCDLLDGLFSCCC